MCSFVCARVCVYDVSYTLLVGVLFVPIAPDGFDKPAHLYGHHHHHHHHYQAHHHITVIITLSFVVFLQLI